MILKMSLRNLPPQYTNNMGTVSVKAKIKFSLYRTREDKASRILHCVVGAENKW
jgi:hypothetical protein